MAGGICKYVPIELNPANDKWEVDMNKLESAVTPKTKLMLINTPHNPTGEVFTREELNCVADILRRNPHVIAITDEVYEKLVYDGREHVCEKLVKYTTRIWSGRRPAVPSGNHPLG